MADLEPADVDFDGPRPVSRRFGDVYFDADGPAEVERVFLAPAALPERARTPGQTFTIGELGFGTGLNFVVAAAAATARLHFVSFERYPLSQRDVAKALSPWRSAYSLADMLIDAYPPLTPGWHRRFFGHVQLSVFFGDVATGLADFAQQQRRGVDAWFLDGFAPNRNPEMWRDALFADIAALSAHKATVTTFTAAGDVRRRLAAHGFDVRRVDQRPHKRHSTAAVFTGPGRAFDAPTHATVVGAGIAGTATAHALASKGISVRLVDGGEGIAAGASAIPAAVLHPRLLPATSTEARYRLQAFLHAAAWLRRKPGVVRSGVLELASRNAAPARLREVDAAVPDQVAEHVDATAASELAGMAVRTEGLFFPDALTIDGKALAAALAGHSAITVAPMAAGATDGPLIRATGADIAEFGFLEVGTLGGQLHRFASAHAPRLPIIADGVFVPAPESVWVGATYEYRPWDAERARRANAERYGRLFGTAAGPSLERFRGTRAVTSDRLPVVGEDGGIWFNLGHGSHGTISAPFGAEIIASAINGEVAPATIDILALLAPNRFRRRQARRPNPIRR